MNVSLVMSIAAVVLFLAYVIASIGYVVSQRPSDQPAAEPAAQQPTGQWVATTGGNPHAGEWPSQSAIVCWSDGGWPVFAYHSDKKAAQRQATKMNELGLGRNWERQMSVAERNRIHAILTGPGLTSPNYMD